MPRTSQQLTTHARQLHRLLTAQPAAPDTVDVSLVCDIGEVTRNVALGLLFELDRAGLAELVGDNQWRLHPDPADTPDPIYAARMITWTVHRAVQADKTIRPHAYHAAPLAGSLRPTAFRSADAALSWYEGARPRLMALLAALVQTNRHTAAWALGEALWGLAQAAGWPADAVAAQCLALGAIDHQHDSWAALGMARTAYALSELRDPAAAAEAGEAVYLARQAGDRRVLAYALACRSRAALHAVERAARLSDDELAQTLANEATEPAAMGALVDLVAALEDAQAALSLATHADDHHAMAEYHQLAATVLLDMDAPANDILDHLDQAEALFTELDDEVGRGVALTSRGEVMSRLGRYGDAADALTEALLAVENSGSARYTAEVLNLLGHVAERRGRRASARDFYTRALAHFTTANHTQRFDEVRDRLAQLDDGNEH